MLQKILIDLKIIYFIFKVLGGSMGVAYDICIALVVNTLINNYHCLITHLSC